ncbi:hypothetical protein JTE90_001895 [Oedothorax gibbosus]|uniref:Uncharacterized protein n=1 Tax=Oedothorax gibbosus TaxID=931172 RepID=A0AAV6VT00_9ARAC|nr:hypothetical protein JTE90_001895 [Oedothorax gibbosus]
MKIFSALFSILFLCIPIWSCTVTSSINNRNETDTFDERLSDIFQEKDSELTTEQINYDEKQKNLKRNSYNSSVHLPKQMSNNFERKVPNNPTSLNKNHTTQQKREEREETLKWKKRSVSENPQSIYKNRKQTPSKADTAKESRKRRKRDEPAKLYLGRNKTQADRTTRDSEQKLLEQIRDLLKAINDKIPRLNISDSLKKSGLSVNEAMELLKLGEDQHKGVINQDINVKTLTHKLNATSNSLFLIKKKIMQLRQKINLHKQKYGSIHRLVETTLTEMPSTSMPPEDVFKLNKYKELNKVLDNLNEQYNQAAKHGHPALRENVLELLEKVIGFEGRELNTTESPKENFNVYKSGLIVSVSAVVVMFVILIALCFFYNYEIRRNSQRELTRKAPVFKVTPRRIIKKKFGPDKDDANSDIEYNAPELTKLLRSPGFKKSPIRPKEVRNTSNRDFDSIERFLKWEEERKRTKKTSNTNTNRHPLSLQSSKILDKLDPRCSFYSERERAQEDMKDYSSGQQSLENWTRNAVRDVAENGSSSNLVGKTSGINDLVKSKKIRKWF